MNAKISLILIVIGAIASPACADEAGGAYGGGTAPAAALSFGQVDVNRDDVVDEEEARSAGIEMFKDADVDRSGVLDQAEFSALEADGTIKQWKRAQVWRP